MQLLSNSDIAVQYLCFLTNGHHINFRGVSSKYHSIAIITSINDGSRDQKYTI